MVACLDPETLHRPKLNITNIVCRYTCQGNIRCYWIMLNGVVLSKVGHCCTELDIIVLSADRALVSWTPLY